VVGDDADLARDAFEVGAVNWLSVTEPAGPLRCAVQIRHRSPATSATVTPLPAGRAAVRFDVAQRAVTPGQAAVFYDGDVCLGGGWIET
jgi:tRNA-specific 2-thiouridylase